MKLNNSIIGSPGSQLFAINTIWPVNTKDSIYNQVQETEVETLLLSGNIDFSTPAEFARDELLPYLKNGKQHIFSEMGHTGDIMYQNHDAFVKTITSYYETGTANVSLYKYQTVNFEPEMSFPQMAKIAVGAIVFVILLLIGLVFLVRYFVRRRRNKKLLIL